MESLGLDEVLCDYYNLSLSDSMTLWIEVKNKSKSKILFFFSPITRHEGNGAGFAYSSHPLMPILVIH